MIYILNRREEVVAVLGNSPGACPYDRDYFTERLENGMMLHEFECPADHEDAFHIDIDCHVAIKDKKGRLRLFKSRDIEDVRDATGIKRRVFSEGKHLELIGHIVRPIKLDGVSAETALTIALSGTGWEPGIIEWSGINSFDFKDYSTALATVHQIAGSYPAEIVFRVEMKNGKVVKKYVDMLQVRGAYNGARFEYGQNVLSITRKRHRTDLITAIIGVGKADPNGDEATFKDISYSFTNEEGTTVTKPVGQDWIGDPDALQRWGENGKHITGVFKTDESDPLVILKESWKMLQARKVPRLSYEMDVALLDTEVDVGDTVIGKDDMFEPPLLVSARVVEYKQSQTDSDNDKIILANFMELSESNGLAALRDLIRRKQAEWETGGEIIYKGDDPPDDPFDGMLWLDTSVEPNVLYRWDAVLGRWVKASPTVPEDIGAETPEGAQSKADEALAEAEEQIALANQRIADAQAELDLAEGRITSAEGTISNAQAKINSVTTNRGGETVLEGTLVTNEIIAESAVLTGTIIGNSATFLNVTMQNANITGSLNGVNGTFTGSLVSAGGTFTGTLSGVNGTFTGSLVGASISSGSTINVDTDAYIGSTLYLDASNFLGGITWLDGSTRSAEIYLDPGTGAMFIENKLPGSKAIYANGRRIDVAQTAVFG